MRRALLALCAAVALSAAPTELFAAEAASAPPGAAAPAAPTGAPGNDAVFSEVRLGILRHDHGLYRWRKESGTDINIEALFRSPRL